MTEEGALILIVDDEKDLRDLVDYNLRQAGPRTFHAASGREALVRVHERRPDLIVLDLNLPDVAGTEVCRQLKTDPATASIPILMLTARTNEKDRIQGFELGADDYVVKPFSVRELVLRVDAIRRRVSNPQPPGTAVPRRVLRAGPVEVDVDAFSARVLGQPLTLPLLEFRLLAFLLEEVGRVRTREELLEKVWGYSTQVETRTIDTHVKRLRDRLGEAGGLIETVRGVGYRIRSE